MLLMQRGLLCSSFHSIWGSLCSTGRLWEVWESMGPNWFLLLGKSRQGVPSQCSQTANSRGVSDSEKLNYLGLVCLQTFLLPY